MKNIGHSIEHSRKAAVVSRTHCREVLERCKEQRLNLLLERAALEEQRRFRDLPHQYKRALYLQYAADRESKRLIESLDEE